MSIVDRARAKQQAIIDREGDPDGLAASDAYLRMLVNEIKAQEVAAVICDGRRIWHTASLSPGVSPT